MNAWPAHERWRTCPKDMGIGGDELHVWRIFLDRMPVDKFYLLLSEDEQGRARRYHFAQDRDYFIAARGALRTLLACYLKQPAENLRFSYAEYGKPILAGAQDEQLHFNVSHSKDLALFAFARSQPLGVDIEYMRALQDDIQLAELFFSAGELACLKHLPDAARSRAFFNCWTRKEAYIKALGAGLSMPLDRFEVSLLPGQAAQLLNVDDHPDEAAHWSLYDLQPHPDYVGALAVKGHDWRLSYWEWPADY